MTEELKTAKFLVNDRGRDKAIEHIEFVLSPEFGLEKVHLRKFWGTVMLLVFSLTETGEEFLARFKHPAKTITRETAG